MNDLLRHDLSHICINYSENTTKEYIISNNEFNFILQNGLPFELHSSNYGIIAKFSRFNIPEPSSMKVFPNGCIVSFKDCQQNLTIISVPYKSEILISINSIDTLFFSLRIPLIMTIKIPFFESFELKRNTDITKNENIIHIGNYMAIIVKKGEIAHIHRTSEESIKFKFKAASDNNLTLIITPCVTHESFDENEILSEYSSYLKNILNNAKKLYNKMDTLYAFSFNTAISNFKNAFGQTYVSAGLHYSFPRRTYFRDSFWTVLPVLNFKPELVREQILILASGVHEDECPSAVLVLSKDEKEFLKEIVSKLMEKPENRMLLNKVMKYENDWWSNHYDSPAYFILLLSEYLSYTNDYQILNEYLEKETLQEKLYIALRHIYSLNENALFQKPFDTNEWADNVFRNGLVTYVSGLHLAALKRGSEIIKKYKLGNAENFLRIFELRKKELNDYLFSKEKGYFVNFIGDEQCDNLSLDIVIPMLFGVLDNEKSRITLEHMERYLETRNNLKQPYGDWGVMSVWHLYPSKVKRFGKSIFPYRYHNGSCWPYLTSIYALVKWMHNMDWLYSLTRWWEYSIEKGWVNPVEYYSPPYPRGSLNQGWSGVAAWVIQKIFNLR